MFDVAVLNQTLGWRPGVQRVPGQRPGPTNPWSYNEIGLTNPMEQNYSRRPKLGHSMVSQHFMEPEGSIPN
jgi:hypothetical protein